MTVVRVVSVVTVVRVVTVVKEENKSVKKKNLFFSKNCDQIKKTQIVTKLLKKTLRQTQKFKLCQNSKLKLWQNYKKKSNCDNA